MNIEDLQKRVLELEGQLEVATKEMDTYKELTEGFKAKEETYKTDIGRYQEQVLKLRDMNTDLFLRVSQPVPEITVEEPVVEHKITLNDILG